MRYNISAETKLRKNLKFDYTLSRRRDGFLCLRGKIMCYRNYLTAVFLGVVCLLWQLPCYAGSPIYTDEVTEYVLTESQYRKLSNNLSELAKINEQSQTALQESRNELKTANSKLLTLQNQLKELDSMCLSLKIKTTEQESLLQNANQSLAELEKEYNLKIKRIKKQRNIAYVIAGCALYAALNN